MWRRCRAGGGAVFAGSRGTQSIALSVEAGGTPRLPIHRAYCGALVERLALVVEGEDALLAMDIPAGPAAMGL